MASAEEREQMIKDLMEFSGKDRHQAEVMVAIELGEIKGDVLEVEEDVSDKTEK